MYIEATELNAAQQKYPLFKFWFSAHLISSWLSHKQVHSTWTRRAEPHVEEKVNDILYCS